MIRLLVLLLAAAGAALLLGVVFFDGRSSFAGWRSLAGKDDRLARARKLRGPAIHERFAAAKLPYPPREILLRAFKNEAELELWAREDAGRFGRVATWQILASSGRAGPKRRAGDRQVPEGFYKVDRFNPKSLYHLSLGLNYPNASDRIRSGPERPGTDIFIHGGERTIGCLPIGDDAIEELYVIAWDTHSRAPTEINVHIFPARMTGHEWQEFARPLTRDEPALHTFWEELRRVHDYFEEERRVPPFEVDERGIYRIVLP